MKALATVIAAAVLGGCALALEYIPDAALKETYERVEDYCQAFGNDLPGRQAFLDRLNSHGDPGGPRATAFDCDGDGAPDF